MKTGEDVYFWGLWVVCIYVWFVVVVVVIVVASERALRRGCFFSQVVSHYNIFLLLDLPFWVFHRCFGCTILIHSSSELNTWNQLLLHLPFYTSIPIVHPITHAIYTYT